MYTRWGGNPVVTKVNPVSLLQLWHTLPWTSDEESEVRNPTAVINTPVEPRAVTERRCVFLGARVRVEESACIRMHR